ncbi:putative RNA-binding Zn ribbon-like protein [Microbacteriaceae bacterium SG_E_30_P1]|uniref:RNA-binding Zn ribbon-like protein n=1 Tax=Antiquaquibacter oligotrophicus TaxID=2880260 RepID=A0ABT6KMY0_9MICO|nr:CGNR zinc finger domain-containing protein [Antiquaquibacter oligotrophicus]MDH6181371.1 putative RNA-binding Zn ribbon-like protein [Antiquaquibacter oligotrophicus]UDF12936.1 CGNR zinc finger domain-containing protein [Antiquaquibacter oligotrophicus]
MHFAPDSEDTLEFIVALGNTHPSASRSGDDELGTVEQLGALLVEHTYSGRVDGDETELREVQQTRDLLREIWSLDRDDAAERINVMLAEARAMPYLMRHDHFDWHLHATSNDAPLAERIRVEAALALADMIRSDETHRMRVCDADDCTGLLLDLSRNGSKRFCSIRCGNRMNQLAFRSRAQEDS